jgi:hypothetical protein
MDNNKLKAKYHEKFRKNIDNKKPYMEQLLQRALKAYDEHPAFNPNIRAKVLQQDREELKVLIELIKLYQSRVELKEIKYTSC